jgi:hypothetical protein
VAGGALQVLAPEVVAEDVGEGLGRVEVVGQVGILNDGRQVVKDKVAPQSRVEGEGGKCEKKEERKETFGAMLHFLSEKKRGIETKK